MKQYGMKPAATYLGCTGEQDPDGDEQRRVDVGEVEGGDVIACAAAARSAVVVVQLVTAAGQGRIAVDYLRMHRLVYRFAFFGLRFAFVVRVAEAESVGVQLEFSKNCNTTLRRRRQNLRRAAGGKAEFDVESHQLCVRHCTKWTVRFVGSKKVTRHSRLRLNPHLI